MDLTTVITIASLVIANIVTTIILFTWATNHAESSSKENRQILQAIQMEMKDFHGRLCAIEEKRRGN